MHNYLYIDDSDFESKINRNSKDNFMICLFFLTKTIFRNDEICRGFAYQYNFFGGNRPQFVNIHFYVQKFVKKKKLCLFVFLKNNLTDYKFSHFTIIIGLIYSLGVYRFILVIQMFLHCHYQILPVCIHIHKNLR